MNSNLGKPIIPLSQTFFNGIAHISLCRGNACSQDMLQLIVQNHANGNNDNDIIRELQQQHKCPHPETMRRITDRQANFGHPRAFRRTGNHRSTSKILGINLACRAFHVTCRLKAMSSEVNDFFFQINRWDPSCELCSESQTCRGNQLLHLTKKKGSTASYQALQHMNVLLGRIHWNTDYPYGIRDQIPAL